MHQVIESTSFEEIVEKIKSLQNPKGDLIQVVIDTIPQKQEKERVTQSIPATKSESSKWQKFVKEAEEIEISDDTYEHIHKCSKEFRDDFYFKHDLTD